MAYTVNRGSLFGASVITGIGLDGFLTIVETLHDEWFLRKLLLWNYRSPAC